jgi:hypothetical protein
MQEIWGSTGNGGESWGMAGKVGEWRGKLGNGGESWGRAGKDGEQWGSRTFLSAKRSLHYRAFNRRFGKTSIGECHMQSVGEPLKHQLERL